MKIQESAENYLETIFVLSRSDEVVRSIDVARHMNFSKPSVSRAMGLLRDHGDIEIASNGQITLTESGLSRAKRVVERHEFLTSWLVSLGVSPAVAAEDACRIEHDLSAESFAALKAHFEQ